MDSETSGERTETLHSNISSDVYDQFIIWPVKHSAVIILQSPVWFRPRFFLLVCLFVCFGLFVCWGWIRKMGKNSGFYYNNKSCGLETRVRVEVGAGLTINSGEFSETLMWVRLKSSWRRDHDSRSWAFVSRLQSGCENHFTSNKTEKQWKNVHQPKVISSNVWFCSTSSPNPRNIKFTILENI